MKKALLFLSILATMASCQQPATEWSFMKVIQEKPQLSVVNLGDTSLDHGDGLAFEAVLRDTADKEIGELHGWLTTVDLSDPLKNGIDSTVDKIGTMVLYIGGDHIVAFGETYYNKGQQILKTGLPEKRAIMGGTGKYRGITGEIITTRNADSTYTHELIYKLIK